MKMKWIPNLISLVRGFVIAPMVLWYASHQSWKAVFFLMVLGGITDGLDGLLAVKLNARTKIGGQILDH